MLLLSAHLNINLLKRDFDVVMAAKEEKSTTDYLYKKNESSPPGWVSFYSLSLSRLFGTDIVVARRSLVH